VDTLLGQLGELWGPSGLIIGFLVVAVSYLYKRVEALQKENTDTLKLVLPIMEKFQTLRAWDRKGGEQ